MKMVKIPLLTGWELLALQIAVEKMRKSYAQNPDTSDKVNAQIDNLVKKIWSHECVEEKKHGNF